MAAGARSSTSSNCVYGWYRDAIPGNGVIMRKLIALFLLTAATALAYDVDVTASWDPPTTGSPAVSYVLEISEDGGPYVPYATTTETQVTVTLQAWRTYVARVAAIDAQDRQGPYSDESSPYTPDLGPPGAPQNFEIVPQ